MNIQKSIVGIGAIAFADIVQAAEQDIAGQLDIRSRRTYHSDIAALMTWVQESDLALTSLDRSDVILYREHLNDSYSPATAKRMWSVTCRFLRELAKRGHVPLNITDDIRGFKAADETTHTVLELPQARALLAAINTNTAMGKRDYAIVSLLLRTGIRRFECSALDVGSLTVRQGHNVAIIQGKGRKRRIVKVPVDVARHIEAYLYSIENLGASPDTPLFVGFRRGDHPTKERISDKLIERLVKKLGEKIGVDITPHGLRATFITLALEANATLTQVQYAAGHADPRTTERYQGRKTNLDNNAVDYIHL